MQPSQVCQHEISSWSTQLIELYPGDLKMSWSSVMSMPISKNAIKGVDVEDTEHPGHPVRVFDENLALQILISFDGWALMSRWKTEMLAEMLWAGSPAIAAESDPVTPA